MANEAKGAATQLADVDPAKYTVTARQAARLAEVSGLRPKQLTGLTVAEISKKFPFHIDPKLLFFQRVCGQVVKTDPVTHQQRPVPYATVEVQDTDCSFLGYFPIDGPFGWLFPFNCHREVIATTQTDECGNFCVLVPRWDIDWVLRWRLERICAPVIFERPDLGDLIQQVVPIPEPIPGGPDPSPIERLRLPELQHGQVRAQVRDALGGAALRSIDRVKNAPSLGHITPSVSQVLDGPAQHRFAPTLPAELQLALTRDPKEASKSLVARLGLQPKQLKGLDLRRFVGPFKRCHTKLVREWEPIIDVPDLTFRVTQDVNGDGTQEQIYGESSFDVRWNDTNVPFTTIEASPIAKAGVACSSVDVPCGNVPAIVLAGRLPVADPATYDPVGGFSLLTNRPHPTGLESDPLPSPAGQAPLEGTLSLFGCFETDPTATHYRVVYDYSADQGATTSAEQPFLVPKWTLVRMQGGLFQTYQPTADADGWYPIAQPVAAGENPYLPQNLLMDWQTTSFPDGRYRATVELTSDGGATVTRSAPVAFTIDNGAPRGTFVVEWGLSSSGPWQPLAGTCPVVRRGTTPADVYFRVSLAASSSHLRSVHLNPNDCGGGSMSFVSGTGGVRATPTAVQYEHWHTGPGDNAELLEAIYKLPGAATQEGTYGFSAVISSRAFNPSGGDGGQLATPPWQYDPAPITIYPSVSFSVINAVAI
jgi:hypothetical protein